MDNLMIIGAATGQLPLIRKARAMGFRTIVVSINGQYPGFDEADESAFIDIKEKDAVLEFARDRSVVAVVTDQNDVCLPTVAYVCENLNLAGIPQEIISLFTNKHKLHRECLKRGIQVPRYQEVLSLADLKHAPNVLGYPFILKPSDNDGSRGVQIIRENTSLNLAYNESLKYSPSRILIAEQYVTGKEVCVQALVYKGAVRNIVVGDSKNIRLDGCFIPSARLFPSILPTETIERVFNQNTKLYTSHGKFFAMIHSEYIISREDDSIYLLDAHIRGAGAYIASHIVPLVTSIDQYDLYIRAACGYQPAIPERIEYKQHAGYVCFLLPQGRIIETVPQHSLKAIPGVQFYNLTGLEMGRELDAPKDKRSRFGPIIICAKSREELMAVRISLEQAVKVRVETSSGIQGPYWH